MVVCFLQQWAHLLLANRTYQNPLLSYWRQSQHGDQIASTGIDNRRLLKVSHIDGLAGTRGFLNAMDYLHRFDVVPSGA